MGNISTADVQFNIYTCFLHKKEVYKKHKVQVRQRFKKDLRNTGRLNFTGKLEKTVSRLKVALSGLLLVLEILRILRNIQDTIKAGVDEY